jgi:hypothetical protein
MKVVKTETVNGIEFYEVGYNRYVIHYLSIPFTNEEINESIYNHFNIAMNKARTIGGKIYTAKWFGGGIVFESKDLNKLSNLINNL